MTGPPPLQPPQMPFTPFAPLPTDEIPEVAAMRARKLGRLIDSAKFESFPPEWQQVAFAEFARMQQIGAQVAQAQAMAAQPPSATQRPPQEVP